MLRKSGETCPQPSQPSRIAKSISLLALIGSLACVHGSISPGLLIGKSLDMIITELIQEEETVTDQPPPPKAKPPAPRHAAQVRTTPTPRRQAINKSVQHQAYSKPRRIDEDGQIQQALAKLKMGLRFYRNGQYHEAHDAIIKALASRQLNREQAIQALIYAAASAYWLGRTVQAREYLQYLFSLDFEFLPDPNIFPPEFLEYASQVRDQVQKGMTK